MLPLTFRCGAIPRLIAEKEAMAAHQGNFTAGDIYAGRRKKNFKGLGKLGNLDTASREEISAQLTGRSPDPKKVGAPGDVIIGAANIAAFLNSLCANP